MKRACSKLVVFKDARIVDEDFVYDGNPIVLFSRQRKDLPYFQNCAIENPLHCPAENRFLKCSKTCSKISGGSRNSLTEFWTGGQYINVTHTEVPTNETGCTGCDGWTSTLNEEWESQEYTFGFSPCKFDELSEIDGDCEEINDLGLPSEDRLLAGYAIDTNPTWLLDDEEAVFPIVKQAIIENDPFGIFPHVVYVHFELKSSYINCFSDRRNYGFDEKDKREKAVAVQVALGFSCRLGGLDPEKACIRLYE